MAGPAGPLARVRSRAPTSTAPVASVATGSTALAPRPSRRTARSIVACRSALAATRTGGAPCRPRRSTSQPAFGQHVAAGSSQADGVRALSAGHEAERGPRRQAEYLLQPSAGHLLDHRGSRGGDRIEGILVPACRQHIRRGCRVKRAADHKPEVTRTGGRHQGGLDNVSQLPDHAGRRSRPVGQRAQSRTDGAGVHVPGENWTLVHALAVIGCAGGGVCQQITKITHVKIITRSRTRWPARKDSRPDSPGTRMGWIRDQCRRGSDCGNV